MDEEYFYDYACQDEKVWRASLPKFTDRQLVEMFQPDVKAIIREKLAEWIQRRARLINEIKNVLKLVIQRARTPDIWFWTLYVRHMTQPTLEEVDNHIWRLQRQSELIGVKRPKAKYRRFTKEEIEMAGSVPIQNLLQTRLKRSGKNYLVLCPLHNEKTPSFYIYTDSNRFKCFGCQKNGNAINLVREIHNYSFKEAVKYLLDNY